MPGTALCRGFTDRPFRALSVPQALDLSDSGLDILVGTDLADRGFDIRSIRWRLDILTAALISFVSAFAPPRITPGLQGIF